MTIIGICGSPRKGNSEFLLRETLRLLNKGRVNTKLILIREKNISLCDGCLSCSGGKNPCKAQDDMRDIYPKIKSADAIIFSSPVWYDMITPYLLNFIDRLNPLQNDLKDKKFAFILTGQLSGKDAEESHQRAINYLKQIAKLYGMNLASFFSVEGAKNKNDVKKREEIIEDCKKLAEKLLK